MTLSPAELAGVTLACLPGMTPNRLRTLFDEFGGPERGLRGVLDGDADLLLAADLRRWRAAVDMESMASLVERRRTRVYLDGDPSYPIIDAVPDRPAVLLAEGEHDAAFRAPRVAIVGTRAATPHGLADAEELGAFLGAAGITVVSGLAIGIDGAAHRGAIAAGGRAVGVVATGLDITYPRRHVTLFDRVRASGLLVGEQGFGVRPLPGRFPVRNRIIAALADAVVVVEATRRGGARITAQHALEYGRPVLAIPGSRRNVAAEGTNELIADGAFPLLDWSDVPLLLGLDAAASSRSAPTESRPPVGADGSSVLRALGGEPATFDQLTSRTGLAPGQVAVAVRALERDRWVERSQGSVWPR